MIDVAYFDALCSAACQKNQTVFVIVGHCNRPIAGWIDLIDRFGYARTYPEQCDPGEREFENQDRRDQQHQLDV